jgi:dimethylaniline monooxygenase (N-oxide forming)
LTPFTGILLTLDLCRENFGSSRVLSTPEVRNITVLGGGKSSADMVYSAVKAGKNVNWVLKGTETTGPGFFLSPEGNGPYKNAFEIAMTRLASTFTPSFMNGDSCWTRLLHSTKYGAKIMAAFWSAVDVETRKDADFVGREALQGFDKLRPHSP